MDLYRPILFPIFIGLYWTTSELGNEIEVDTVLNLVWGLLEMTMIYTLTSFKNLQMMDCKSGQLKNLQPGPSQICDN